MAAAVTVTTGGLLPTFLVAALAVQIRDDLSLRASTLGIAVACFFGAATLVTSYFGTLADRIGGAPVMRLACGLAVFVLLAIAGVVQGTVGLVLALAVGGGVNGAIQPSANRFLVRAVPEARQGLAFGVKQAAIPAAGLLSGLAVPAVGATVGWRWAFVIAAGLAAVAALAVPVGAEAVARDRPRRAEPAADDVARGPLVVLAAGMATGSAAANAIGAFFVLSAVHTGVSDSAAGLLAALGSLSSLLVRLLVGHRADRRTGGHLRVVAGMSAAGTIGLLLLAFGGKDLLVPAAIVAYGAGWGWAGLFNYAVARSHPHAPGRATGITQVGASAGACLGPLAFGFLADQVGYPAGWTACAVLLLIAAALIDRGWRRLAAAPPSGRTLAA